MQSNTNKMIYKYNKENLRYDRIILKSSLFLVLIIVMSVTWTYLATYKHINNIRYISQETKAIILKENYDFSEVKLKEYILDLNIRFPHIVMAQAKIETGNFTSPIFRENNNLFGMKIATKRPTTNKGENRGHAYYDNWRESVLDYAFLQAQYLSDIKTEKEYLEYLRQYYAENPKYVEAIILELNNIKNIW